MATVTVRSARKNPSGDLRSVNVGYIAGVMIDNKGAELFYPLEKDGRMTVFKNKPDAVKALKKNKLINNKIGRPVVRQTSFHAIAENYKGKPDSIIYADYWGEKTMKNPSVRKRKNPGPYQVVNGTSYHAETPAAVISALESARASRERVRIHYGDVFTGRSWLEENDTDGYIGRSTGTVKIPLIVNNARSPGGPGLLDHCIVKIRSFKSGRTLYQHPKFHVPPMRVEKGDLPGFAESVLVDDKIHARFKKAGAGERFIRRMKNPCKNPSLYSAARIDERDFIPPEHDYRKTVWIRGKGHVKKDKYIAAMRREYSHLNYVDGHMEGEYFIVDSNAPFTKGGMKYPKNCLRGMKYRFPGRSNPGTSHVRDREKAIKELKEKGTVVVPVNVGYSVYAKLRKYNPWWNIRNDGKMELSI